MIKKIFFTFFLFIFVLTMPNFARNAESGGGGAVTSPGSEYFGYIFDVEGFAELKSSRGEPIKLDKKTHLLQIIKTGDRLRVVKSGKISLYSIKENRIYEVTPNTLVQISSAGLSTIKGETNTSQTFPLKAPHNPIEDLFTVTVLPENSCIKAISPVNTSIDSLTPTLKWNNTCKGTKKVTVKLISDKQVIYETKTGDDTFKVLKDLLDYNKTYTWLVDGGVNGVIGYTFTTLDQQTMANSLENKSRYKLNEDSLPLRLSYMMYLKDKNLTEEYQREVLKLSEEFPDIPSIKVVTQPSNGEESSVPKGAEPSEEEVPEE